MSIAEKLQEIIANNEAICESKTEIATAIASKGVTVPNGTKLDAMAGLIDSIEQGGGGTSPTYEPSGFYLNKCVLTIDDGYQIERIPIHAGDVIELGEGQDVEASTNWGEYYHAKSHPAMTFQEWASSIEITNNQFVVPDDIYTDFHVGAIYCTADDNTYAIRAVQGEGFVKDVYQSSWQSPLPTNKEGITACWLGSLYVPLGVEAFMGCSQLMSINLPASVSTIYARMFQNCSALQYITLPTACESLPLQVFRLCVNLQSINIPHSLGYIGDEAFAYCKALRSLHIFTADIGASVFLDCAALNSADVPSGIFESLTFSGCVNLNSINIHDSSRMEADSFSYCSNLVTMILGRETPPVLESTMAFMETPCTFLVPVGSVDAYEAATNWSTFAGRIIENTEENRKKFGIW